jgi:hypothetical protein
MISPSFAIRVVAGFVGLGIGVAVGEHDPELHGVAIGGQDAVLHSRFIMIERQSVGIGSLTMAVVGITRRPGRAVATPHLVAAHLPDMRPGTVRAQLVTVANHRQLLDAPAHISGTLDGAQQRLFDDVQRRLVGMRRPPWGRRLPAQIVAGVRTDRVPEVQWTTHLVGAVDHQHDLGLAVGLRPGDCRQRHRPQNQQSNPSCHRASPGEQSGM